jgi:hypothetical protein
MAMFQQYQNGVRPVTGMAEAGANIGKMYMQGIGQMSEGLTKGIQEYHKNSALNDTATEEGHAVGQQLAFYHQMASMSPENATLLPMLDEQIEAMKKLPTMSLTQKLGTLNGAKSTLSQFGQNLQMNQLMQQQKTANAIDDFKPQGQNVDAMAAVLDNTPFDPSLSPQQNIDTHLRKGIESAKANGFNVKPDNEVISAYLADVKGKLDTAVDASGKPIDAQTKLSFSEQLDKYKNFTEGKTEQGYTRYGNGFAIDENGMLVESPNMETVGTYNALTKSVDEYTNPNAPTAEKIAELKATDTSTSTALSGAEKYDKKLKALKETGSQLETRKKELEKSLEYTSLTGGWHKADGAGEKYFDENGKEIFPEKDFPKTQTGYKERVDRYEAASSYVNKKRDKFKVELEKVNSQIEGNGKELDSIDKGQFSNDVDTRPIEQILAERKTKELLPKSQEDTALASFAKTAIDTTKNTLESIIRTNGSVSVRDLITQNNKFEIEKNPTRRVVTYPSSGLGVNPSLVTPSRFSDASSRIQKEAEKLGISLDSPMNSDQMNSLMKALEGQSVDTANVAKKASENLAEIKPSNMQVGVQPTQTTPEKRLGGITTNPLVVGTKEVTSDLTLDQKKEQAKQWFRENKQFGYIPSSFNSVWEQQHPESKLQVITASNGMQFYSDGKGEWKPVPIEKGNTMSLEEQAKYAGRIYKGEEIAVGTGVRVQGVIQGDEPSKFKTEMTHAGSALNQIDSLLSILQRNNGRSFSPEQRAEAEKYVAFLKSMVRGQLFPSGRVAEWEQVILDKIVPNPTAIFSLDASTLKGLTILREQTVNNIKDNAVNRGLQINFNTAPKVSALAQEARQARAINRPK